AAQPVGHRAVRARRPDRGGGDGGVRWRGAAAGATPQFPAGPGAVLPARADRGRADPAAGAGRAERAPGGGDLLRPGGRRRGRPGGSVPVVGRCAAAAAGPYLSSAILGPMRTLLVTNDFPPRPGGIQSFVHNLALRLPADSLVVYASTWRGAAEFDARQPFEVVREDTSVLLPTPAVGRRAVELARACGCDAVWFGAAAPLGVLAHRLRRQAGVRRAVALTHGHEVGWAALPGARAALRRIARGQDVVTYLGEYTRIRLARAIDGLTDLRRLVPGVDVDQFHPGVDGGEVRRRYGLVDRPVVVCVSRLVPRKGQDML